MLNLFSLSGLSCFEQLARKNTPSSSCDALGEQVRQALQTKLLPRVRLNYTWLTKLNQKMSVQDRWTSGHVVQKKCRKTIQMPLQM